MSNLRILTFSTLYPNAATPGHGIFVEQRLRNLVASGEVDSRVVAPVPWFPFKSRYFGSYSNFANVPDEEDRHNIVISHPRFPRIPKIGMSSAPAFMAAAAASTMRKLIAADHDFDLIDAHYFYPDGVAAVMLGHKFGKPVLITARGSDLNLLPQYYLPRKMIQWAAAKADGLITVCQALKDKLICLGVPDEKVTVLRNGVDLDLFRPAEKQSARDELGIDRAGKLLLSVGNLISLKGHDIPIRALTELPNVHLLIAGQGDEEQALRTLADDLGVADRVTLVGSVPQEQLKTYFSAADALVLASSREGWANVLLESMACGTPVIASNVGGTPEVVTCPEAGVLMQERTPRSFLAAYHELMRRYPDPAATRRYAEQFSWEKTTQGQLRLMRDIIRRAESDS